MFLGDFLCGPEGPGPRRSQPQEPKAGFEEWVWRLYARYKKLPWYVKKTVFVLCLIFACLWAVYWLKR